MSFVTQGEVYEDNKERIPNPKRDKSKIICWNCGKPGHYSSEYTEPRQKTATVVVTAEDEGSESEKNSKEKTGVVKIKATIGEEETQEDWVYDFVLTTVEEESDDYSS